MSPVEIAFFSDSYLPVHDGVAHEVSALARALTRLGHGVKVFAPHPIKGASPKEELVAGVPVVRSRSLPVPYYGGYRWALFPFPQLRGQRFRQEVDVVHLHTPGIMGSAGFFASRQYRKPLLGTFHTNVWAMRGSFPPTPMTRLFFRAAWWYTLGTYWRCDRTTAPTTEAARTLEEAVRKPFARPIEVVPNGIEVERFRPGVDTPDWRVRCGLPEGPMVTFLGRLTEDKGVHRFLDAVEAVARHRPISAVIGGSGPEAGRVRERIAAAPLAASVRYLGPIAEEEKPALLSQSAIFVLPSTSDTSSLSLLEAMASGAAAIASDRGGLPGIVRDGENGLVVPIERPEALAEALDGLLADDARRRRLGEAGRRWVDEEASIEGTARRFISLYGQLLDEPDAGSRAVGARATGPLRPLGG